MSYTLYIIILLYGKIGVVDSRTLTVIGTSVPVQCMELVQRFMFRG
jgi:hypothetical protein